MPRSDYLANLVNVFRSFYILLLSALALVWFYQHSLATWWQLTYHEPCPWSQLSLTGWT
ncbi:hypothetical protein PO486_21100 [Atlantibacter hermannii]